MPSRFRTTANWLSATLVICIALTATAWSRDFCKVCHSEVEVQFRDSAHYLEDLTCATCHGGDPTAQKEALAHGGDFRAGPTRAEVPEFCASCHSDPSQMHAYGLPVDQYALYQTSTHGRKLALGDTTAAVCTDCHGTHRILPRTAPDNPTNRRNISTTCGRCHADGTLMEEAELTADVVEHYEASVHAEALRQRGDPQVPDCSRCHGSHGAAPPGTGDINKVCGQCHGHTRDAFRQSPHWRTMAAEGWGDCAACHDNHRVERPTSQMWISTCKPCHDSGSEAARTGEKILAILTQAEEEIAKGHQAIDRARAVPLDVTDYEARLNTASAYLVETRPLSHSLNIANIEDSARKARSVAQEVQATVHKQLDVLEGRNLIVVFVWIYILITIVAIQYYKHSTR